LSTNSFKSLKTANMARNLTYPKTLTWTQDASNTYHLYNTLYNIHLHGVANVALFPEA
jgi:hypothetical protein